MAGLFDRIKSALKGEASQLRAHAAARDSSEAGFKKLIVESIINTTLERAQKSGRYKFQLKDEPRHNQVIVAAWELMEFSRPGVLKMAACGTAIERTALFQTAMNVWGYLVDFSYSGPRTNEARDNASDVSSAIFMRPPGASSCGELLLLGALASGRNDFSELIREVLLPLSASPKALDLVLLARVIDERIQFVASYCRRS